MAATSIADSNIRRFIHTRILSFLFSLLFTYYQVISVL